MLNMRQSMSIRPCAAARDHVSRRFGTEHPRLPPPRAMGCYASAMHEDMRPEALARVSVARDLIAPRVRELTLRWYQSPDLRTERKADGSVVTPVDREGEDIIRSILAREFPDDAILGEERGSSPPRDANNRWRWVLDPIDGTGSFVRGLPHWVLLVGIEFDQRPVAGVIDVPVINETLWASSGAGAFCRYRSGDVRPARVSAVATVERAMIEIGPARYFRNGGQDVVHARLCAAARRTRGWSDGYAFALLATGRVDAAINFGFHRWDLSAPAIIIEQAGGRITDWRGEHEVLDAPNCLASNSAVHDEVVAMLRA